MSIEIRAALIQPDDTEVKGTVNPSAFTRILSKFIQPTVVTAYRKNNTALGDSWTNMSTELSSHGDTGDTQLFGVAGDMSATDEVYISDSRPLKQFSVNIRTPGVFTATGLKIYDSNDGIKASRELTITVDNSDAFRAAIGWHDVKWTTPATPAASFALSPSSSDPNLNTPRYWYRIALDGFTGTATTAPIVARIAPVFTDDGQRYNDITFISNWPTTTHAGHPFIPVTFLPMVGDSIIYVTSNPAKGFDNYVFRMGGFPVDVVQTAEYYASDNTWKALSVNDPSNGSRNGPAVLTEPPDHFEIRWPIPLDFTPKTLPYTLANDTVVSDTGYYVRYTTVSVGTPGEYNAAVVAQRAVQYGALNVTGIIVPTTTIKRVSVDLTGPLSGTASETVFAIEDLTTGTTRNISVPQSAVQGAILSFDIVDMTFADGDALGITKISGTRGFADVTFHLL